MDYIDYAIIQEGKSLSSDKIKINKYDNKISRLVFTLDGTIPGRLYLAMKNPITGRYFYNLLTDDAVIIGTSVSMYVGRWDMILLGVSEDYDLDELNDIDQEKVTYVSDTLKKLVVIDNFLSDDCGAISYPALDEALDDFARNREEIENNLIQTGEDVSECEALLVSIQEIETECKEYLAQVEEYVYQIEVMNQTLTQSYNTYYASLKQQYETYKKNLEDLVKEVGS